MLLQSWTYWRHGHDCNLTTHNSPLRFGFTLDSNSDLWDESSALVWPTSPSPTTSLCWLSHSVLPEQLLTCPAWDTNQKEIIKGKCIISQQTITFFLPFSDISGLYVLINSWEIFFRASIWNEKMVSFKATFTFFLPEKMKMDPSCSLECCRGAAALMTCRQHVGKFDVSFTAHWAERCVCTTFKSHLIAR